MLHYYCLWICFSYHICFVCCYHKLCYGTFLICRLTKIRFIYVLISFNLKSVHYCLKFGRRKMFVFLFVSIISFVRIIYNIDRFSRMGASLHLLYHLFKICFQYIGLGSFYKQQHVFELCIILISYVFLNMYFFSEWIWIIDGKRMGN